MRRPRYSSQWMELHENLPTSLACPEIKKNLGAIAISFLMLLAVVVATLQWGLAG